jgi:flagellar basal body-associated protein FliL
VGKETKQDKSVAQTVVVAMMMVVMVMMIMAMMVMMMIKIQTPSSKTQVYQIVMVLPTITRLLSMI